MLKVEGLHAFYGKSHVLHGVDLEVGPGELVGLLGRNGMGKTTTLKAVMGLVRPARGRVEFRGEDLRSLKAHQIPGRGIALVPQGRGLFPELTVLENLRIAHPRGRPDPERLDQVFEYFPRLRERSSQKAGTLSGGEQQMLAIGRALVPNPRLILFDEPSEGLMPLLVRAIHETVRAINAMGVGAVLVEQNVRAALSMCHRVYILEGGRTVWRGRPDELDDATQQAYLGVG
ncbi:ABC transporter ATP-binding protein [Deferrisoma camini]|uniref:ABC transporter ATP-binding protein n=1 Tax=Deferrisoma camini TaxID=1035120 RepID=UPI00046D118B|nr:ABC transporter ATP-binding protein [Deferrisoma camini]